MFDLFALSAIGLFGIMAIFFIIFIDAIFLWVGTKLSGIEKSSFGKAILCVFVLIVLSAILGSILGSMGFIGAILSFVVTLWVVKSLYDTSWTKSFFALLLAFIAFLVLVAVFFLLLGIGLSGLAIF